MAGDRGAVGRGESQGERYRGRGGNHLPALPHCSRGSQCIKAEHRCGVARLPPTDFWGQTTTHAERPEGLGWSAWKRPMDPGLVRKSLPGLSEGGSGCSTAFMGDKGIGVGAIGGRCPPGIRKPRQSSPTMETILRGGELPISGGMQTEARIDRDAA